jgi:hypothetical protein
MQAQATWKNRRVSPASSGGSFHERNIVFTKCANWNCPQQFRYFRGTMVFRVETLSGSKMGPGKPSVAPQVEYHWLCVECLRVILISFEDHSAEMELLPGTVRGGNGRIVRLTSLDSALAELSETAGWSQTQDLAPAMDRGISMSLPDMPGSENGFSGGGSPATRTRTSPGWENEGETDSSRLRLVEMPPDDKWPDDKWDDKWKDKWKDKPKDEGESLAGVF